MESTMTVAGVVTDIGPVLTLVTPYLLGGITLGVAWKLFPKLKGLFTR